MLYFPPLLLSLSIVSLAPSAFPARDAQTGWRCSIAPVADVDQDGRPDFAIARREADLSGVLGVHIRSGRDGQLLRTLLDPEGHPLIGQYLESIGDVDGDGHADLLVIEPGRAFIYSGIDAELLHELGGSVTGAGLGLFACGGMDATENGVSDELLYRAPERSAYLLRQGLHGTAGCTATRGRLSGVLCAWNAALVEHPARALSDAVLKQACRKEPEG